LLTLFISSNTTTIKLLDGSFFLQKNKGNGQVNEREDEVTVFETIGVNGSTAADRASQETIERLNSTAERGKVIRIFRQLGTGKESMEFVAVYPADQFTIDDLIVKMQAEHGGGNYRFMVYNEKGRLSANKLIPIAAPAGGGVDGGDAMQKMFAAYMERQERVTQALMARIDELSRKEPQKQESRADFLREMMIMKEIFTPQGQSQAAQPPLSMREQISGMREMMGLASELNGSREEEETALSVLDKGLPLLTELVKAGRGETRAIEKTKPARAKKTEQNQEDDTGMINIVAEGLIGEARAGSEAKDVATEIVSKVPRLYKARMKKMLHDKELVIKLVESEPALSNYEEWLGRVLEECKRLMS